jgi:hypothetical protein
MVTAGWTSSNKWSNIVERWKQSRFNIVTNRFGSFVRCDAGSMGTTSQNTWVA